ncbi:MAG: DinB family protein [Flavobacteriaceae bacterium]|nr:DinB family protein [Flavobacteriaceae bacterium]
MSSTQEYWLSGPIPDVPALLQPAAHALLQSVREVKVHVSDFPEDRLWEKPFDRASVGFHLRHLTGVLDRLLTYAKEETLTDAQFQYLKNETNGENAPSSQELTADFQTKVDQALDYFKTIPETTLTDQRFVGRKKLPTTMIGLLFHAAEHSQRHVGQLLVTVSVLKNQ